MLVVSYFGIFSAETRLSSVSAVRCVVSSPTVREGELALAHAQATDTPLTAETQRGQAQPMMLTASEYRATLSSVGAEYLWKSEGIALPAP